MSLLEIARMARAGEFSTHAALACELYEHIIEELTRTLYDREIQTESCWVYPVGEKDEDWERWFYELPAPIQARVMLRKMGVPPKDDYQTLREAREGMEPIDLEAHNQAAVDAINDYTNEERQAAGVINEAARAAAEVERRFRDLEREVTDEPIDEVAVSGAFTNTVDLLYKKPTPEPNPDTRATEVNPEADPPAPPANPARATEANIALVWNGYSLPADIDELPTDEKHALALDLHEKGMSHAEIHEATGIPRGSVGYCVERGMAKRDRQTKPAATKDEAVKIVQVLHIAVAEKRRDTNDIASFFPGLTGGMVAVIFTDYARELEELQRVYDEGSRDDYQRAKGELLKALKGEK